MNDRGIKLFQILFIQIIVLTIGISSNAIGQIKVLKDDGIKTIGEANGVSLKVANDTLYCIIYQDIKFRQLTEFKQFCFFDTDNALDNLYKIIMDGLGNPPKDDIIIELPEQNILKLKFVKSLGVSNVQFYHIDKAGVVGVSPYLIKKHINKLFGKV